MAHAQSHSASRPLPMSTDLPRRRAIAVLSFSEMEPFSKMMLKNRLFIHPAFATTLAILCGLSAPAAAQPAGAPQFGPQYGPWGFDLSGADPKAKPGDSFD